jgi:hypothetical protein
VGNFLTMSSVIQCPHGGMVTAITSNTKAKAGGAFILCASDTFTVAGCTFVENPCLTVTWPGASGKSAASGVTALTTSDTGLTSSGATPMVSTTQTQASGT